jgi:hypothetical protein
MAPPQKTKRTKQIDVRFKATDLIGFPDAENDTQLESVFVDTGRINTLCDTDDPRCVVTGRTGAGKSALLVYVESTRERVKRIDPLSIAIDHLQYSTGIPGLTQQGVNFDAFFKFMWRQTIAMEILQAWHAEREARTLGQLRTKLAGLFASAKVKLALDVVEKWIGDELLTAGERSKAMIAKFDQEIAAAMGRERLGTIALERVVNPSTKSVDSNLILSDAEKAAVQASIARLSGERADQAFAFLPELLDDRQKQYFVLIDHLDTAWIDSAYAYDLIEALISVAGEFARIPNVKVLIALREDLIEAMRRRPNRGRRQWEKVDGVILRVSWSAPELIRLADLRLEKLLKGRYSGEISLSTLLPPTQKHGMTAIDYLLSRTHNRPRDVIAFVNACLASAAAMDRRTIGWDVIEAAEENYSRVRVTAMVEEWEAVYPGLLPLINAFRGMRGTFTIDHLAKHESDRLGKILAEAEMMQGALGPEDPPPLPVVVLGMLDADYDAMWNVITAVLLKIGFLGLKPSAQEPLQYVTDGRADLVPEQPLPSDVPLAIHPMFAMAIGYDARAAQEGGPPKERAASSRTPRERSKKRGSR